MTFKTSSIKFDLMENINALSMRAEHFQLLEKNARYVGKEGLRICKINQFAVAALPETKNTAKPSVIKFMLQNHLLLWDDTPATLRCEDYSLNTGVEDYTVTTVSQWTAQSKIYEMVFWKVNDDRKKAIS